MKINKREVIIGVILYLIILSSVTFLPSKLIDKEWRACATSLQNAQPDVDPSKIDTSSCGIKKESVMDFLLSVEHNFIKGGLPFTYLALIYPHPSIFTILIILANIFYISKTH